jgi:Xaa-Pro aminopeptidase
MINLSKAKFLYGCRGVNLDVLARGPLWDIYMDYKCGTGHGVSHIGNVHEGPNGFRWKIVEERNDSCILEPGMITTNEPGVYIEGSHGIRIENELLCVELCSNEYGKFLGFETITFAPIDLDCIDKKYLSEDELLFLNNYHQEVYEKLSVYLNDEEKEFLRKYTRKL